MRETMNGFSKSHPRISIMSQAAQRPLCQVLPGNKGYVNIAADDQRLVNHGTHGQAIGEAERIARKSGKVVIVYGPIAIIEPPAPVVPPCTHKAIIANEFAIACNKS